jgi:hypothetical protein
MPDKVFHMRHGNQKEKPKHLLHQMSSLTAQMAAV